MSLERKTVHRLFSSASRPNTPMALTMMRHPPKGHSDVIMDCGRNRPKQRAAVPVFWIAVSAGPWREKSTRRLWAYCIWTGPRYEFERGIGSAPRLRDLNPVRATSGKTKVSHLSYRIGYRAYGGTFTASQCASSMEPAVARTVLSRLTRRQVHRDPTGWGRMDYRPCRS